MKISNNQQLYAAVRSTSVRLMGENRPEEEGSLKAALSISSSAGEVLGEIRFILKSIKEDLKLSPDLNKEISREIDYINSVLK